MGDRYLPRPPGKVLEIDAPIVGRSVVGYRDPVEVGPATSSAIIAIGIAGIAGFARITSNMTAAVAHNDFVGTARLLGVRGWMLFTRHLLPNIGGPLLVLIASSFALSLLDISSLSFVGLGVQSPDYDWGRLLNEGLPAIYSQPMQVVAPSMMLIFAGVARMLPFSTLRRPGRGTTRSPARSWPGRP